MFAPSNSESGQEGSILISQDPISPYVVTWDAVWKWHANTPVPVTPIAGATDLFEFTVISPTYIVITNVTQNIG
jgi:hypothetical protein